MTTTHPNALVAAYLRDLELAAKQLGRSRRTELTAEISEHIDAALLEAGAADEAAVRNVLERLGPAEEIAAAAAPAQRRSGRLELAAVILLAIPFLGWIVGTVLVVASRAWSGREKAVGFALGLVLPVVMLFSFTAVGAESGADVPVGSAPPAEAGGGSGLGPIELFSLGSFFLSGPLAALYLASRLRRTSEPAGLVSA